MKVMVRVDMEGLTGVVHPNQCSIEHPEYAFGRRMLRHDLAAVLEGFADAGVSEAVLFDVHATGRNVDVEALPAWVRVIAGKPSYTTDWPGGLDESFAGMALLGFHAKAGHPRGVMPHTYEGAIAELRVNGRSFGEIGVEAMIAGEVGQAGVPTVLVTGDEAGCREARDLFGESGVVTAVTKHGVEERAAVCLPPARTADVLRQAARVSIEHSTEARPLRTDGPVTLEIDLKPTPYRDAMRSLFAGRCDGDGTYVGSGGSVTAVWAEFWAASVATYAEARRRRGAKVE